MSIKTTAAPLALLLAAASAPAFAQTGPANRQDAVTILDSGIVTGQRNPDDPAVTLSVWRPRSV